jgi:hypothetical protein
MPIDPERPEIANPEDGSGSEQEEPTPSGEDDDADDAEGIGILVTRASGPRRQRPHLDPGASLAVRGAGRRALRPAAVAVADPDERFARALTAQRARMAKLERTDPLRLLADSPIKGMGRVPYASNAVFVLELDVQVDSRPLHAIYKPARGERPLWDFPHRTLHLREVATHAVDRALGFGLVPATVLRDGPHGPGSVQTLVEAGPASATPEHRSAISSQLLAMAALDVLINNADRKSAHLLVSAAGRLYGIDHGLTFLPYPRQRTVLLELGGAELPDEAASAVGELQADRGRRTALRTELAQLLSPDEVAAFVGRLAELAADPVYPRLDPWDGRPFEWW